MRVTFGGRNAALSLDEASSLAERFEAKATRLDRVESRIADLRDRIQHQEQNIRNLGFEKSIRDIEDWQNLAEHAKREFEKNTLDAILSATFTSAKAAAKELGSLSPPMANRMISELRDAGIDDPSLASAIRSVAAARGKPAQARAVVSCLDRLQKTKDVIALGSADNANPKLEALGTALSWLVEDPALELLMADVRFATFSAYAASAGNVSLYEINRISTMNESNLKTLKFISEELTQTVKQLNAAKDDLNQSGACE